MLFFGKANDQVNENPELVSPVLTPAKFATPCTEGEHVPVLYEGNPVFHCAKCGRSVTGEE